MSYMNIYFILLGFVLIILAITPFVPSLRKMMLDPRDLLDLAPFEFYIGLLEIMDTKYKRSDFLGALGLAALYIFSIFFAMIPPALILLLWPLAVIVLVLAVPFYFFMKKQK
jgi:hypothetical protein